MAPSVSSTRTVTLIDTSAAVKFSGVEVMFSIVCDTLICSAMGASEIFYMEEFLEHDYNY